jgi:branched-subunit amino acid ABC-type transport system permease component
MHFSLLDTVLIAGFVNAGLYGILPISIILSYRISRTIAFVHGGIAAAAALAYWLLCFESPEFLPGEDVVPNFLLQLGSDADGAHRYGHRPEFDPFAALLMCVAMGAVIGAVYGWIVMSRRIASLNILTLTVVSLGAMMGLIGFFQYFNVQPDSLPASPFGSDRYHFHDVVLTQHRLITLAVVAVLSMVLGVLLTRTHTGLVIRALADDQEAGVWCGVRLRAVGTLVYAGSGALAALAGVAIAVTSGPNPADMLLLFLQGLGFAAVGGMRSIPLAFFGALVFSFLETALIVGFFGDVDRAVEALVLYGALLAIIVTVARFRKENVFLLERQSL